MNNLKSCPHCGGENSEAWADRGKWRVSCGACAASTGLCKSEAEAVEAWNRRAVPECPAVVWDDMDHNFFHVLKGDIDCYKNDEKDKPFTIIWGCGVSGFKTEQEMRDRIETWTQEEWNRIHGGSK